MIEEFHGEADGGRTGIVERRLSLAVNLLSLWYVIWTAYSLVTRVPRFADLFAGLGAELPLPTRLVISVCTPRVIWPLTLVAVVFLIVKEFKVQSTAVKALTSVIVFMLFAGISAFITFAIQEPLISLIGRIK